MDRITFNISNEEQDQRLDSFLAENLDDISRSYIQRLISEGYVTVNGKQVKPGYKIKEDDLILAEIPEPEPITIKPEDIPLDIIYEDKDLLVVNKPAGMVVHPASGNYTGTLVNALLAHCQDLSGINGKLRPGIVHRIDKDTSGLLVVAKNDFTHVHLAKQFKEHSIDRAYLALVQGVVAEPGGIIDAPIGRHPSNRKKMAVVLNNSKKAVTKYFVRKRYANHSLLECRLETGRTHQIRVHLAYINHPVVGDPLYGFRKNNLGFTGQALHAYLLGFAHPRKQERLEFSVELPKNFLEILERLEREVD